MHKKAIARKDFDISVSMEILRKILQCDDNCKHYFASLKGRICGA